jgi:hypothetical protein
MVLDGLLELVHAWYFQNFAATKIIIHDEANKITWLLALLD